MNTSCSLSIQARITETPVLIGAAPTPTEIVDGRIDDARISNGKLGGPSVILAYQADDKAYVRIKDTPTSSYRAFITSRFVTRMRHQKPSFDLPFSSFSITPPQNMLSSASSSSKKLSSPQYQQGGGVSYHRQNLTQGATSMLWTLRSLSRKWEG